MLDMAVTMLVRTCMMQRMSGRALNMAECRLKAGLLTAYVVLPCSTTAPLELTLIRLEAVTSW